MARKKKKKQRLGRSYKPSSFGAGQPYKIMPYHAKGGNIARGLFAAAIRAARVGSESLPDFPIIEKLVAWYTGNTGGETLTDDLTASVPPPDVVEVPCVDFDSPLAVGTRILFGDAGYTPYPHVKVVAELNPNADYAWLVERRSSAANADREWQLLQRVTGELQFTIWDEGVVQANIISAASVIRTRIYEIEAWYDGAALHLRYRFFDQTVWITEPTIAAVGYNVIGASTLAVGGTSWGTIYRHLGRISEVTVTDHFSEEAMFKCHFEGNVLDGSGHGNHGIIEKYGTSWSTMDKRPCDCLENGFTDAGDYNSFEVTLIAENSKGIDGGSIIINARDMGYHAYVKEPQVSPLAPSDHLAALLSRDYTINNVGNPILEP